MAQASYRPMQLQVPTPPPNQSPIPYDANIPNQSELNALFSINPELLHRKVHPVIHSIHSKPDRTKPLRVRPRHLSLPARSEQAEQCSSARNSADSRESGHRSDAFRF